MFHAWRPMLCGWLMALAMAFGWTPLVGGRQALAADRLVVHEWGTFTALQNEHGAAVAGINVDDEPLPRFVHDLNPYILGPVHALGNSNQSKGAPQRHPYVTLRLETPVIYFHPPAGKKLPPFDVEAELHGGWLTQFYPLAAAEGAGLKKNTFSFGPITADTAGKLTWRGLRFADAGAETKTDSAVWTAPRNVQAASVRSPDGEQEKYLFYRGVGNFSAPLEIAESLGRERLEVRARFEDVLAADERLQIDRVWLVHVRKDGSSAFRAVGPITVDKSPKRIVASWPATFAEAEFSRGNLAGFREELHAALERDGLYADEASALLATWKRAYFESPGLRVFFLVPRTWTEHYLSLKISVPHELQRVMVARIELVSPEQRELLDRLERSPLGDPSWR